MAQRRRGSSAPASGSASKNQLVVYQPPDQGPKDFRGRHTTYTEEIAAEIIQRHSEGEPLSWICKDEHMPSVMTVWNWRDKYPEFSVRFERAKAIGHDAIADSALADVEFALLGETRKTKITPGGVQEVTITRDDNVARSVAKASVKMKLLAMWSPRYRQAAVPAPPPEDDPSTPKQLRVDGGLPEGEP